jgi:DNA-binding protein YbaB
MKETLIEYAALKAQMSILEDKMEALKPEVERIVIETNPTDQVVEVEGVGTFTMVAKRKYIYPAYVIEKEEAFKEAKKEAEAKGDAQASETRYLKFNSANIE